MNIFSSFLAVWHGLAAYLCQEIVNSRCALDIWMTFGLDKVNTPVNLSSQTESFRYVKAILAVCVSNPNVGPEAVMSLFLDLQH